MLKIERPNWQKSKIEPNLQFFSENFARSSLLFMLPFKMFATKISKVSKLGYVNLSSNDKISLWHHPSACELCEFSLN